MTTIPTFPPGQRAPSQAQGPERGKEQAMGLGPGAWVCSRRPLLLMGQETESCFPC